MAKEGKYTTLRMPSGEMRMVLSACMATIGQVGNADQSNITIGKAGRSRWLGVRPQTRGTAMNPVDHPHGGGEGRNKGRHPVSPWGRPTKGAKTRKQQGLRSPDRVAAEEVGGGDGSFNSQGTVRRRPPGQEGRGASALAATAG